jgi:hypothetical protein
VWSISILLKVISGWMAGFVHLFTIRIPFSSIGFIAKWSTLPSPEWVREENGNE